MKKNAIRKKKNYFVLLLLLLLSIIVFIFPIYWMVITSLKYNADIYKTPPALFPERIYLDSYISQIETGYYNMFQAFFNSSVISISTLAISLGLSIPAAYGLARFNFRGNKILVLSFLITQMLPAVFVLTPLFIIFSNLNFINTYIAPIIADSTIAIPFSVLILRTYFLTIPKEIEESAKIDGCANFGVFMKIMVPISYPGIIVAGLFSFMFAWGDLAYGLTFIRKQMLRPITAGIFNFLGQYGIKWNYLMAFGVVTILPIVIIFVFMQKYIISGLTIGAVKG